jgi:2-succinyl-5-enolpyruvyl-6-hydroxy-3-cyclohexene-1-carboxylate synthase
LNTHVLVDERSAGFFALGIARETGRPAILVATSGSAPAHWLPAVIEAAEDRIPMILVSADRPPELVGCGANQATRQAAILASHARGPFGVGADATAGEAFDVGRRAAAACLLPVEGPAHVNVAIRDPLAVPDRIPSWQPSPSTVTVASSSPSPVPGDLSMQGRGVIVCGRMPCDARLQAQVAAAARALNVPILADILSGLRASGAASPFVVDPELALRACDVPAADWSIEIGGPPVSRRTGEWTARSQFRLLLSPGPDWADPDRGADRILVGDLAQTLRELAHRLSPGPGLLGPFQTAETAAREQLNGATPAPPEGEAISHLFRALPPQTPVFAGNSMVVRDVDAFAGIRETAGPVVRANRGVSGIDGNLSTAAGMVAAAGRPGIAILGDLGLFHDLNALHLLRRFPITVLVLNNAGGGIFGLLPQRNLAGFEELWLTPTDLDLAAAAAAFGLDCRTTDSPRDAASAVAESVAAGFSHVVELRIDRRVSEARRRALWEALPWGGLRP